MIKSISVLNEVKGYLEDDRKDGHRIRTIYLRLRRMDRFKGWSDLVLLNSVVESLTDLKLTYSKKEIYAAFKCVDVEEYDKSLKREIFKSLIKKSKIKSVF